MAEMRITVSEIIEVPEGAEIAYAPTGLVSGIRLADGRVLKPWITYELEEDGEASDLGHDELTALGLDTGHDLERSIDRLDENQGDEN